MDGLTGDGRVLIVEDDREIAKLVSTNIEDMGLATRVVHDGKSGLDQARRNRYDLIILDLMLPRIDGMTLCRMIREDDAQTAIMILTARAEEIDRILGLELGADDYMTKPFSVREMTARVKALLRRTRQTEFSCEDDEKSVIAVSALSVDLEKHRAFLKGKALDLTVKEFELLSLFMRNPGRVFSRQDPLQRIWSYQFEGYEHTVNTHINRLRNKIESDPSHPEYLLTVWGIGYRFAEGDPV